MELILREIYYKDGTKTPFLFIEKENYDNLIFNFELDNEGNFITNLNYGFIDNFNANNLINNIFDKYNTTYIDKKLWERVVEDSKKEFEKKGIVKSMYILEPPYITAIDTDFNDLENYKTKLIKKIDYKTINSIYVNMHKVLEYNIKFSNEEQYTYGLIATLILKL